MEPITLGAILTALVSFVISAINRLTENPIMAYFLVLAFLIADGGISFALGQGIVGGFLTPIVQALGIPIIILSWQITIIFGIFPLLLFSVRASLHK